MLTYQVRKRRFKISNGSAFTFPGMAEIIFRLQPLQPFGLEAGNGRTFVAAQAARLHFNCNSGHHFIESKVPLSPVQVIIQEPGREVEVRGNELKIRQTVDDLQELENLIMSVFFGFPMLLNVELADPPVVERVEGRVGDVRFAWELIDWQMISSATTQEFQEERIGASWKRMEILGRVGYRRLIAALHYFHVFCRLCRAGHSPWEFMSEAIINLSKVLEVLFPPSGSGKTLDAARAGLTHLGYQDKEIEQLFVPAMALRNNIDSAHVDLSLFSQRQLSILHSYTEAAEPAFQELLQRVLVKVGKGEYEVAQYTDSDHRPEAANIIARMEAFFWGD